MKYLIVFVVSLIICMTITNLLTDEVDRQNYQWLITRYGTLTRDLTQSYLENPTSRITKLANSMFISAEHEILTRREEQEEQIELYTEQFMELYPNLRDKSIPPAIIVLLVEFRKNLNKDLFPSTILSTYLKIR